MEKKYKNYPGMKMIKRATGSSKVESTMYKAGQKMRNILDKGLLSFIKKPAETTKKVRLSSKAPFVIPSGPATKAKQAGDIFKKLASSKVAKVAKFARVATPVGAALTIASGLGTYEKGKSPQELAKKASEKGKEYKVADEFTVVGSEGTKKVKMKSQGGMIIGKQADYIKDLI